MTSESAPGQLLKFQKHEDEGTGVEAHAISEVQGSRQHTEKMNALIDKYFIKRPKLRRWVTTVLERDKDCDVELFGATIRINSIKEHGYLRASRFGRRSSVFRDEAAVVINLAWLLHGADAFVDVGANVGLFCHVLARFRRIAPSLRIYAFEANPDTFNRLTLRSRDLGIEAHSCAISNKFGELEFVGGAVSHVFTAASDLSPYSIQNERVTVSTRRLDSFKIIGNSLLLKVDVEGQEQEVLEGATELFKQQRIRAVYLDGYREETTPRFLIEHGFVLYNGRTLDSFTHPGFSLLAVRRKG